MRERFINFKKEASERLNGLLRAVLDMPPSYEEAYLNFKHGKNCSQSQNLVTFTFKRAIIPYDPSAIGNSRNEIMVDINFLECPECHSSVRFSGESLHKDGK